MVMTTEVSHRSGRLPCHARGNLATRHDCQMKIAWVIFEALEKSTQGIASPIASIRYRALLPALELAKSGVDSNFVVVPPAGAATSGALPDCDGDAVTFSKSFNPVNETLAQHARGRGAHVVFDISDNHFDTPEYAAHNRAMAGLADAVTAATAATAAMAAVALQHTGRYAFLAPAGTPREVVKKLNEEITRFLATPAVRERLLSLGAEPSPTTPEQANEFIGAELLRWDRLLKAARISAE